MEAVHLTAEATALLRRRLAGEWVGVTDENRPIYRELVAAGLMDPLHTMIHGNEGYYRPTVAACQWSGALNGLATRLPSPEGSPSPEG